MIEMREVTTSWLFWITNLVFLAAAGSWIILKIKETWNKVSQGSLGAAPKEDFHLFAMLSFKDFKSIISVAEYFFYRKFKYE